MARRITVETIAREAGVSKTTISAVLSGKRYQSSQRRGIGVSEATRDRVIAVARQLGYRPADPATLLRIYPEEGHFCLLMNRGLRFDEFYSELFVSITDELQPDPLNLNIAHFDADVDYAASPERAPHAVHSAETTRFLVLGPENESLIELLQGLDKRVAYLGRVVQAPGVFSVSSDFFEAARIGVEHLIALGHKRIAVVGEHYYASTNQYHAGRLIAGAERAMQRAGLPFEPNDVHFFPAEEAYTSYPTTLAPVLKRSPKPTAVFCMCDWTAVRAVRAIVAAGLDVPRDISVVGCNDDRRAIGATPHLTTVHVGIREIGAAAVRYLRQIVPGEAIDASQLLIRPRIVERDSTSPRGAGKQRNGSR